SCVVFFFQAEDGIRDRNVTGVQTCALPISLWQDVISFDNEWLEEQGLYDPTTHSVDEDKMIDVTRKAMEEVLNQEGINPNTVLWSGSIHYNTDNIHVHTAMVQPQPTVKKKRFKNKEGEWVEQFKGQRKQKSLDRM